MSAPDQLAALDAFIERVNAELDAELSASERSGLTKPSSARPATSSKDATARLQRAADLLASLERLAKAERQRAGDAGRNAAEWERNAVLAVRAKDDDLARDALARKADELRRQSWHQSEAERLGAEVAALREMLEAVQAARSGPPT